MHGSPEHDTTEENLRTFGGWVRRYGRPLAHYTDKNSIFERPARSRFPNNSGEIRCERSSGEALSELGLKDRGPQSASERAYTERAV